MLRERERHIALLEHELAEKDEWLRKALAEHQALMEKFLAVQAELERSNRWAAALNEEIAERRARIAELQEEMAREQETARQMAAGYEAKVAELEEDIRAKTEWARDVEARLTAEVQKQTADLGIARGRAAPHGKGTGRAHRLGAPPAGGGERARRNSWR